MQFREVTRVKQRLEREECIRLLETELRGVLSVTGDGGYPYGLPINHYYCPEDGKIYFHSNKKGHKIDAVKANPKASYCVYDTGTRRKGSWALDIKSVVVFGSIEIVEDREKVYEMARRLSRKFTDDEEYIENEIRLYGPATFMFALVPEHITGKIVNEA